MTPVSSLPLYRHKDKIKWVLFHFNVADRFNRQPSLEQFFELQVTGESKYVGWIFLYFLAISPLEIIFFLGDFLCIHCHTWNSSQKFCQVTVLT